MSAVPDPGIVNLTINGRKVSTRKGTLLVEAARQVGIDIPVFCYHPKLKPVGACRMCLVEIEKMPRLQTACTTPVAEGMVVQTQSTNAAAGQNAVLELLLANHPLDCPICDKGGECPLQDNTFRYGPGSSRMQEEKRRKDKAFPLSDRIVLDKERCILCYRCTRFQAEIPGDAALVPLDRGGESEIGTQDGEDFASPFSGNTIELCPVGALTSRFYRFRARPWDLQRTPSVCSGCAVGCNVSLQARDGAVLRVLARENPAIDDGWLCDHGRFQTPPPVTAPAFVSADQARDKRALQAHVRRDGRLQPVALDEALQRAGELLRARSAVLCAPTLTDAGVQALAGVLRPALPQAQIGFLPRAHTPWLVQGRIANLPQCRKLLLLGLDPWTDLPVLALWLRKATTSGGALVAIGDRNGLARDTAAWLRCEPARVRQQAAALLAALDSPVGADAAVAAAAARLGVPGPAAVLLHPDLADDAAMLDVARRLAEKLGADGATGMCGAPALGANARGAQTHAPELAAATVTADGLQALLLVGLERLPPATGARLVVATSRALPERDDVEVVLPLAHPYETAGNYTNFEGTAQRLQAAGFAARGVLADHELCARLAAAVVGAQPAAGARR